ncbi:hypothetical protein NYA22BAC_02674 [Parasphingorhabdus sp. NYA22]
MSDLLASQYLSRLASCLGGIFDAENEGRFFSFNSVKFVKFIRLSARNMNGGDQILFRGFAAMIIFPYRRRVF